MPRAIVLLTLSLTLAIGGCTFLQEELPPEQNAALRLEQGLAALDAGLYSEAFDDLAWVYSRCPRHEAGHQALAALAALELDPRNDLGRPDLGTQLLGELVQRPGTAEWVRPMAETTYLMALVLGAPPAGGKRGGSADPGAAGGNQVGAQDTMAAGDESLAGAEISARPRALPGWDGESSPREQAYDSAYGCGQLIDRPDRSPEPLPQLDGPSLVALLASAESQRDAAVQRADTLEAALATARQELAETRTELERIRKTLQP